MKIWGSVLLHSGMLFFTGSTFTMFFYAMTGSMLAFASWPKRTDAGVVRWRLRILHAEQGVCGTVRPGEDVPVETLSIGSGQGVWDF
jgi:hypothetical protein